MDRSEKGFPLDNLALSKHGKQDGDWNQQQQCEQGVQGIGFERIVKMDVEQFLVVF